METATQAAPRSAKHKPNANAHDTRESWLRSAMAMIAPLFEQAGSPLPDTRRAAIGFTSRGGKGNCLGECWHSTASGDGHFEIFIRPDKADPAEVLGILTHELVHAAVPIGSGHGKVYKDLALRIGLEGKMRHALPGPLLAEKLAAFAADLGPLPHAALDISFRESAPRKKQKTNMLKAYCEGGENAEGEPEGCDYIVRLTKTHAERGAPFCGVHDKRMKVEWPDDEGEAEGEEASEAEPEAEEAASFKAPPEPASDTPSARLTRSFKAPPEPAPEALAEPPSGDNSPSPGYEFTDPEKVYPPGHRHRVNLETGRSETSLDPLA